MGNTQAWMEREVIVRQKSQLDLNEEESMDELVEAIKKPEPPMGDA